MYPSTSIPTHLIPTNNFVQKEKTKISKLMGVQLENMGGGRKDP